MTAPPLLPRSALAGPVLEVAPTLLGAVLEHRSAEGTVAVRLTEVEAYDGENDPGSHAFRGRTARNAVMFGEAGHVYVYFTYGMHYCVNVVCGHEGKASAVLLRAGEVVAGTDLARSRRTTSRSDRDLASGPARLTVAMGIDKALNGADALAPDSALRLLAPSAAPDVSLVRTGPRVGVAGEGAVHPWRFWVDGDPTVSAYRAAVPRRRPSRRTGESAS